MLHVKLAKVIPCRKVFPAKIQIADLNFSGGFAFCDFFIELGDFLFHYRTTMGSQLANLIFAILTDVNWRQHFDNHQTIVQAIEVNFIRCSGWSKGLPPLWD